MLGKPVSLYNSSVFQIPIQKTSFRYLEILTSKGFACIPTFLSSVLSFTNTTLKLCTTWKEEMEIESIMDEYRDAKTMGSCPKSCLQYQYNGDVSPWKFINKKSLIKIFYVFPIDQVQVFEEYLMFSFNDLIGTIGGHSGLFIGFSFYGFFCQIIEILQRMLKWSFDFTF